MHDLSYRISWLNITRFSSKFPLLHCLLDLSAHLFIFIKDWSSKLALEILGDGMLFIIHRHSRVFEMFMEQTN